MRAGNRRPRTRIAGETDDIATFIDCRRRVPPLSAEISKVGHSAVFPKHGVLRGVSSNGLIADSGNADDLTIFIDCRRSSGGIAGDQRQSWIWSGVRFSHTAGRNCRTCGETHVGIMNVILRPSDYLPRLLAPVAKPLFPPGKLGSPLICQSSQTNPRLMKPTVLGARNRTPRCSRLLLAAPDRQFEKYQQ